MKSLIQDALICVAWALTAWQLWRAKSEGKVSGKYGEQFDRAKSPSDFWLVVGAMVLDSFSPAVSSPLS
jgi:hypothetical protein